MGKAVAKTLGALLAFAAGVILALNGAHLVRRRPGC
jgi:hypothetical protein